MLDREHQLQARFASVPRRARTRALTVNTTTRVITLGPGGWRLYGSTVQVFWQTRAAKLDATLATGEPAAPADADMVASTAGTPTAGKAYGAGFAGTTSDAEAGGSVVGALQLPTDTTAFEEIAVPKGGYVNLYLRAGSAASPVLAGPFE